MENISIYTNNVCFLLGLICLHNYISASSIYTEAIKINSNQNTSKQTAFAKASKFKINNDSQVKQNISAGDEPHTHLTPGAIVGIVIGTMVGFCIFCCFCLYCIKGCLAD